MTPTDPTSNQPAQSDNDPRKPSRGDENSVGRKSNPAGPHATPDLNDDSKTPGSGMLPEPDDPNPSPSG